MPFRSQANAFSLLYHTFWCKFKRQHISLKFIYFATLIWLPTTMALYDDGCSGVLNGVHAQLLHVLPSSLFTMSSKCVSDVMVKWKMKSWAVTRVIMWLLCDHGVDASKDWVFVAHFIHLFNTTMPIPCTDIHSGAPMSHLLHRRIGMGCQALNFLSRGNYVFKMSRMHACLQNVQPLYKTFNAPALWKTSQVWVSSAARQERPSMFFNFTKTILVNIWILN